MSFFAFSYKGLSARQGINVELTGGKMTEATKAPEVQEATPSEPASTVAKKKTGTLKVVLIIVGVIVVIAAAIIGYGVANAYSIKSYAKKAETIFNGTKKWDDKDLEISDLAEAEKQIKQVKADSTKYLVELNGMKGPAKAKTLESELKEYFTKANRVAGLAGDLFAYLNQVEKVTKIYTDSFSSSTATTPEAMIAEMETQKTQMQSALAEMDKISVPDSMKSSHTAFRKMIADTIPLYDQLIAAYRTNDFTALGNAATSSTFTQTAEELEKSNPQSTLEKELEEDSKRLDQLEGLIPAEISRLKEVNFTF